MFRAGGIEISREKTTQGKPWGGRAQHLDFKSSGFSKKR
jgi:hypothetical protein